VEPITSALGRRDDEMSPAAAAAAAAVYVAVSGYDDAGSRPTLQPVTAWKHRDEICNGLRAINCYLQTMTVAICRHSAGILRVDLPSNSN